MTDFSDRAELVAFLGRYAPFDGLDAEELDRLVHESTLKEFGEDAVILDGLSAAPEHAWVVLRGRVGLWNFPTVPLEPGAELPGLDDVVGPGGVFGYVVILAGAKGGPRAVTLSEATLLRLPAWAVEPMFSTPAGAAFLASELAKEPVVHGVSERRERTAAEIVRRDPVVCAPDTSIRDAAVTMTEARCGYVVVTGAKGPAGIVTDHDLRARVISTARPVTDPISEVMTSPLYSVLGQTFSSDVLIEMLDRKLHYMPVVDDLGTLLGVVQDIDFLTAPTTSTFALQRQIEHAPASELPELGARIREIFPALTRQQEPPRHISGVAAVAIEAMVRRCIELELPVHPELHEGDFTWLSLGSVSRREVMPSSDVDSAVILTDLPEGTPKEEIERRRTAVLAVAAAVHTRLEECGIPSDTNGAVAATPRFCRTEREWRLAAQGWIADPLSNQAMMMASLMLDARPVWGDLQVPPVAGVYQHLSEHPRAFMLMLREALMTKARIRSFRDVISLRGGTFDIKSHALTPVVNIARWAALARGSTMLQTRNRLAAGAGTPILSDDSAEILLEVFTVLMRLRLEHQVGQMNAGRTPTDVLSIRRMSPLSRSLLEQAVREVASVQRKMGNLATYLDDSEWVRRG